MHLPELAAVCMLGFARRVKGWRDGSLTAKRQTQIRLDKATGQAGGTQHQSESAIMMAPPQTVG